MYSFSSLIMYKGLWCTGINVQWLDIKGWNSSLLPLIFVVSLLRDISPHLISMSWHMLLWFLVLFIMGKLWMIVCVHDGEVLLCTCVYLFKKKSGYVYLCVEYIQPICLPAYGQRLIDGQMGTVTGWGNVGYYGEFTFHYSCTVIQYRKLHVGWHLHSLTFLSILFFSFSVVVFYFLNWQCAQCAALTKQCTLNLH